MTRNKLGIFLSATLALALALTGGCVTSEVKVTRGVDTDFAAGDAIVIFPNRMGAAGLKDVEFAECLEEAILSNRPDQRFVGANAFRDAFFPWFEPNTAPDTPDDLRRLLARPVVQNRISELGVHYVIVLAGSTQEGHGFPGVLCGGTGCLGLAWWDRETKLTAIVWDMNTAGKVGEFTAMASGTAVVPAFVIPLPFIPPTETTACNDLGRSLVELLTR